MELHLKIIGVLLVVLALVHVTFPTYFKWRTELQKLSLINRQMMEVHTFFIALMVFLMGIFCLVATHDIVHTKLGKQVSLGLAVFWGVRLLFQFFVYSPHLWKGKQLETTIHLLAILFWSYLTFVFTSIFLQ